MLPARWNKLPSRTPSLANNHHRRLQACAIERHRAPPNLVCTKPPHSVLRRVRTQNLVVLAPPIRNRIADARSSPNLMHACAVPSPATIVSPAPSAAPTVLWVSGHASCAASPRAAYPCRNLCTHGAALGTHTPPQPFASHSYRVMATPPYFFSHYSLTATTATWFLVATASMSKLIPCMHMMDFDSCHETVMSAIAVCMESSTRGPSKLTSRRMPTDLHYLVTATPSQRTTQNIPTCSLKSYTNRT